MVNMMTNSEAAGFLRFYIESRLTGDNEHNLDYLCNHALTDGECTLEGLSVLNRNGGEKWKFTIKLEKVGELSPDEKETLGVGIKNE